MESYVDQFIEFFFDVSMLKLHHPYSLVQKWGVVHWPKSLWGFKSEISSLYFSDIALVKVISL